MKVKSLKRGYFKGNFAFYSVNALFEIEPFLTKTLVAKRMGISRTTLYKILNNKFGVEDFRLKTIKKVTTTLQKELSDVKQVELALLSEHLKLYRGVSKEGLKKIKKKAVQIIKKRKDIIEKEQKYNYVFFKVLYGVIKKKIKRKGGIKK